MKKIFAVLITFLTVFLCSCSDKNTDTSDETTSAEQTSVSTTISSTSEKQSEIKYSTEWGTDLLPADFPPPPSNTHSIEIKSGEANKEYSSDWVRIQFTCPENEIYRFTNTLIKAGYIGGSKKIEAPSVYFPAGFNGYWQNGKNYIRIAASEYDDKGELTVLLDIAECKDNFPMVLTSMFPKFNGFSKNSGLYSEYDKNKNKITNDFIGSLNAASWTWDFGFENTFVGVSLEEVEAYVNELVNAEFSGASATSITDGCTVVSYDLIKKVGDKYHGVFIAYNQILKTMDILYTNDASIIVNI